MGRRPGSKNKPKQALEAPQNLSKVSEVKEAPKRAQKAKEGAKKPTGAAPKVARQKALSISTHNGDISTPERVSSDSGVAVIPGADKDYKELSVYETGTSNRAIIDLATGQILGAAFDITAPSTTKYSHSFIQTLAKCTAAGYFRKSHAKALKVFALERGSCVHSLIEEWEKHGKDPVAGLPEAWRHYILDNAEGMSEDDRAKIEKEYRPTEQMLSEFVHENQDIRSKIRQEDVEVPFEIEVTLNIGDKQIKRIVVGKIDLIIWLDKERTKYNLIDHKTTATVPGDEEIALDTQFSVYQLAAEKLFGKPPLAMFYYHLKGTHMCSDRFSSVAHPREVGKRVDGCEIGYAKKVPKKTPDQIQSLLDTYYAPSIIRWEAQSIGKDGLADPKNRCVRCEYRDTCSKTTAKDLPVPVFVR